MPLSFTSRLHLPFWSSGNDVPTRDEFNDAFAQLEGKVPVIVVGTETARPAADATPGKQFYYATDTGRMWFMDGSAWQSVGRAIRGTVVAQALQASDPLLDLRNPSGTSVLSVDAEGGLSVVANESPTVLSISSPSTATGGSAAVPGYYRSAESRVSLHGEITLGVGVFSTVLTVPRPRDLKDHFWRVPSGTSSADALLSGSNGTLVISNASSTVWLDSISYYAER